MGSGWISTTIVCEDCVVCSPIDGGRPLLHLQSYIDFRANLLFNAWQAAACDGRGMNVQDLDRMEEFQEAFAGIFNAEIELRKVIEEFGDFLPAFLHEPRLVVPRRALEWTRR